MRQAKNGRDIQPKAASLIVEARSSHAEGQGSGAARMSILTRAADEMKRELAASDGGPDDAALIARAREDRQSFTAIYQRYLNPVYLYCYVRLGNREAAEDATSEVFLKALAGLDGWRGGAVAAWLFRIAHNVVIDVYRQRHAQADIAEADEIADPAISAEDAALEQVDYEDMRTALAMLPADQRAVLELQFTGWSGAQIGAALQRSPGAVRMLRLRAIETLREIVAHEDLPIWAGCKLKVIADLRLPVT